MASSLIRYFDRYSRTVKTEQIYGEAWMRLIYGNPLGRMALWLVVRRTIFSHLYGLKMKNRASALRDPALHHEVQSRRGRIRQVGL